MEIKQFTQNRGVSIEKLYTWFKEEKFLINRRYQRKLVWTVEEKEALIESINRKYPLPLVLAAETTYQSQSVYEIIDGMQRLEAIFAFIEGRVAYKGKYFDLDTFGITKNLKDKGELKQNLPKWDREFSLEFTNYEVPLLTYRQDDEKEIDEIFKRINYYGKHLSEQELRQVGSDNRFGNLVRKVSEIVRGDVSHADVLSLNNMSKISISNSKLPYGIKFNDIFWKKHGIVTNENIRKSRDEELVANILAGMLLSPREDATAKQLNKYYDGYPPLEDAINKQGEDYIIKCFDIVFSEMKKTFETQRGDTFANVLFRENTKYVNRAYQVFFLAFYELLIIEEKVVVNHDILREHLRGLGDIIITNVAEVLNLENIRLQVIQAVIGNMSRDFRYRDITDPVLDNGIMKLESLLSRSKTENANYDYKIGFHSLSNDRRFDENAFEKVMHSLVAMANISRNSVGYIVIGVADKDADKERFEQLYSSKARRFQNFWITGIQEEAATYSKKSDEYLTKIKQKIQGCPITPKAYIDDILASIDCFNYYDKEIIILRIQGRGEVAKYNNEIYQRQGTSTEKVSIENEGDVWKRVLL